MLAIKTTSHMGGRWRRGCVTYVASTVFSAIAAGCKGQRPQTACRMLQAEALEQALMVSLDDTPCLIPAKA